MKLTVSAVLKTYEQRFNMEKMVIEPANINRIEI